MTDAARLLELVEIVEGFEADIKVANEGKRDIYKTAKSEQFDPQAVKDAVSYRRDPTKAETRSERCVEYLGLLSRAEQKNASARSSVGLRGTLKESAPTRTPAPAREDMEDMAAQNRRIAAEYGIDLNTLSAVPDSSADPTRRGEPSPESPNTACPPSLPDKPSSVAGTAPNNVGAGTPAALEPASPPVSDAAGTIFDTPADGSIPEFLRRYPAAATAGPN